MTRGSTLVCLLVHSSCLCADHGSSLAVCRDRYVLETVVTSDGVVIVSNVNCGYLDMSTNFLLSVREASGAKVGASAATRLLEPPTHCS